MASTTTTFPQFTNLPAEIQHYVWEFAARNTLGYRQLKIGMSMSTSSLVGRYIAFPGEVAHAFGGIVLKKVRDDGFYFPHHSGVPDLLATCHDSRRVLLEQMMKGFMTIGPHINRRPERSYNEDSVTIFYDKAVEIIGRLLGQMRRTEEVVVMVDAKSDGKSIEEAKVEWQ